MQKNTIQFVRGLVLIPFLTAGSPFAMLQTTSTSVQDDWSKGGAIELSLKKAPSEEDFRKERVEKIDLYFEKRDMPLHGYGEKLMAEAEKNHLDWRLLPAIAIKESTGGKFACGNNPFGWGSCKLKFKSYDEAIETVARNLGGNNPNTARYYKNNTTIEKLHHYNNSVVPTYTKEIFGFMELIENEG